MKIPLLGLGTWQLYDEACTKAVKWALDLGYTHIDTAHVYDNHRAIAKGLKGWDRTSIFITSKLTIDQIKDRAVSESVEKACDRALKELKTDYLDLYLLHWPDRTRPMQQILEGMQRLKDKKKVRAIGVSNCTIRHLQDFLKFDVDLTANQVEFHPYLYQKELLSFCRKHKIILIAYRPFGKGGLLKKRILTTLSKKYSKTPSQILLRWLLDKKIPTVTKSSKLKHLKENIDIFDFKLEKEDRAILDTQPQKSRFCNLEVEEFDY